MTFSGFFSLSLGAVALAAALDILANIFLVKSDGFRNRRYGFAAIFLVCLAFTCLAFAVRSMDLSVAYALWGGFGILGTSIAGVILFRQKLNLYAVIGLFLLIGGMAVLKFS